MVERIILRRFDELSGTPVPPPPDPETPDHPTWMKEAGGRIADKIGGAGYSRSHQRDIAAGVIAEEFAKLVTSLEFMEVGDAVQDRRTGEFAVVESIDPRDPSVIVVWYHTGGRMLTRRNAWIRIGQAEIWPNGRPIERNPNA